jgi:glycine betaine/choline ABC-type transport system substrate-binding protein
MVVQLKEPRYEKDLIDRLKLYSCDYNWVRDNYSELVKQYPQEYIAVKNMKVRYHEKTMKELIDRMQTRSEKPSEFAVEFLTDEKCAFLF